MMSGKGDECDDKRKTPYVLKGQLEYDSRINLDLEGDDDEDRQRQADQIVQISI